MLPIRLATDEATRVEAAAMMLVTKKMVPSWPSGRLNLPRKKYVIQDSEANPEANESTPNKMKRRITSDHRSFSMDANTPFFLGRGWGAAGGVSPSRGWVSPACCCSASSSSLVASTLRLSPKASANLISPTALYPKKTVRHEGTNAHPCCAWSALMVQPQTSWPRAAPALPTSEYQAKTSGRCS